MGVLKVIFLGTSASMPTSERNLSSVAIKRKGEIILFDCAEGTQRQMVRGRIGFRHPTRILLSHLHGDHVLGLPGLLQTMSLLGRERGLDVYGPVGTVDYIRAFTETLGGPVFPLRVHEIIKGGVIVESLEYMIEAVPSDHEEHSWALALVEVPRPGRFHPEKAEELGVPEGPLWGRLQRGEDVELEDGRLIKHSLIVGPPRRGRKIVYSGDTRPSDSIVELARDADILIHEATFDDSLEDRAQRDGHSTASQAAAVAAEARVDKLFLTHLSSRYPDPDLLLEQARKVFSNTIVAHDLMEVEVHFRD